MARWKSPSAMLAALGDHDARRPALNAENWTSAYSADNKLTEVKQYDTLGTLGLTVDYKYDAFEEMIQKSDGTTTTKFGSAARARVSILLAGRVRAPSILARLDLNSNGPKTERAPTSSRHLSMERWRLDNRARVDASPIPTHTLPTSPRSRPEKSEVMNRLAGIAVFVVLALTGIATYFHLNPHQLPRLISTSVPGFQVPEPRSPVTNFRPPQF